MEKIFTSLDQFIGKTPLLELTHIERAYGLEARLLAKLEYLNPAGSAKDRVAKNMLDDAERRGLIAPGSVIIEPTSGNTGIGLAAVGAARGYRTIIVMPDTMSLERRKLMAAYGAELVLSEGAKGMAGAIEKAEELHASIPGSFIPAQFDNPANPEAHYLTTGPEILEDTDGRVDYFVAGVGTGGTVTGVGRYLKENKPGVKIIAVEPASSPLLTEGRGGAQAPGHRRELRSIHTREGAFGRDHTGLRLRRLLSREAARQNRGSARRYKLGRGALGRRYGREKVGGERQNGSSPPARYGRQVLVDRAI